MHTYHNVCNLCVFQLVSVRIPVGLYMRVTRRCQSWRLGLSVSLYNQRADNIHGFVSIHSYGQMFLTRWAYVNDTPSDHHELVRYDSSELVRYDKSDQMNGYFKINQNWYAMINLIIMNWYVMINMIA